MVANTPDRILDPVPRYLCNVCGHAAVPRGVVERLEALMAEMPGDPATARVTRPDTT